MNKQKSFAIITIAVVCCIAMALVDGFWQPGYFIKSAIKILLFLVAPVIYSLLNKDIKLLSVLKPDKKGFKTAFLLAVPLYFLIIGAYLLLKNVFDFSPITTALTGDVGVTRDNFIFVALYISFVNSLLEEFFFRGFIFLGLKKIIELRSAHIISAFLFSVYHIAIMSGWFSLPIFILSMVGLFAGGIVFNLLNSKFNNIYISWLVHMFANFAINTIGLSLFGII